MTFSSVLCAVDFSDHSIQALRYAVGLAGRDRAHLTVLAVNEPLLVEAAAAAGHGSHYVERETEKELRRVLLGVVPGGASWAPVPHLVIRAGMPHRGILSCAANQSADLIVMGTHGLGRYRKMFFGSVTERVLRQTSVQVLAVPWPRREVIVLSDREPILDFGHVMAPVDLGETSEGQVRTAATLARSFDVPLLLVHVVTEVRTHVVFQEALKAQEQKRVDEARERLERLADVVRNDLVVDTRIGFGRPADEIAAIAADQQVGLIVMGIRAEREEPVVGRPGSVAYRVLCLGPAPVLALPPRDMLAATS